MRNRLPCGRTAALALCLGLGAASACNKNDGAPKASGLAPTGSAPAAPPPAPAPGAPADTTGGGTITGVITLAPERKGDVSPSDVLFLSARKIPDSPGGRGTLVAAKRFTAASFPLEFTMSKADLMMPGGAFEGDVSLTARVDKDGDPISRKKGDVFGTVERVHVGATGVEVKLTELQKADESLIGPPGGGPPPGHPGGGAMPPGHPGGAMPSGHP